MPIKDKERWERLAALGAKSEIPTPEGEAKMSAVILQLAEPLIRKHGKTVERAEAIIMLTIAGWNKSMFPTDKQPIIEKDLKHCVEVSPQDARKWYFDPATAYLGELQKRLHGIL